MMSYELDRGNDWVQLCNGDDVFLWTSEHMKEKGISDREIEMLELFMNKKEELDILSNIMQRGWTLVWRKPLGDYIFERMNKLLKVADGEINSNVYFKFMLV